MSLCISDSPNRFTCKGPLLGKEVGDGRGSFSVGFAMSFFMCLFMCVVGLRAVAVLLHQRKHGLMFFLSFSHCLGSMPV